MRDSFSEDSTRETDSSGYIRALPRPTQEDLDIFYRELYYGNGVSSTYHQEYDASELNQKVLRAEATIEFINRNIGTIQPVSLIEIGCGEGFALAAAKRAGWETLGVDYQSAPVKKFNEEVLDCFVESDPREYLEMLMEVPQKFDIAVLQNVLEHVIDPEQLLTGLKRLVGDNGYILIQVPNDFSRTQQLAFDEGRIEREYWFTPPQHINYFNKQTLEAFCGAHGLRIVDGMSDFPIEMYLWGGQANYTNDGQLGPFAHRARVSLDLTLAESGMEAYLDFYRAAYRVGLGRNLVVLVTPDLGA